MTWCIATFLMPFGATLPPSTKLNEESLSEIFGVSRTIIRRALLRLSLEQVVDIKPNRGATVSAPTIEEALKF